MPRRDGTGPRGGHLRHRAMRGSPDTGPGGHCVCPRCSYKTAHTRGQPCNRRACPECGAVLVRE